MLCPDMLKLLQPGNGEISKRVYTLKDHFWGYESDERHKIRRASNYSQRSEERREKENLPPPAEEESYYSGTNHWPATDEETDAEL